MKVKTRIVKNMSNKDIIDYPISEAQTDKDGNVIINPSNGQPKSTGNTYEWNIMAGETLEFPSYVADYLLKIYPPPFLEDLGEKVETEEDEEEEPRPTAKKVEEKPKKEVKKKVDAVAKKSGELVCGHCGQEFKKPMTLGAHIGAKHPEVLGL